MREIYAYIIADLELGNRSMNSVSVIIPIYNEEDNIIQLHKEVLAACLGSFSDFEIIFVNDGSTDKTLYKAAALKPLKIVSLRKNFGQTAAMDAGIKNATKDLIVTMDGDLQNDPKDIPLLVNYLIENNLDVVSGWRKKRHDPFMKKFVSRGANFLRGLFIDDGIHDSGCSLKAYKRRCFEKLDLYGEMHRFIPGLLLIKGYKVGEIEVNHRPRVAGITKYNWKRTVKGFIDMIAIWFWKKYAVRPLHLLGGLGIISFALGSMTAAIAVILYFNEIYYLKNALPVIASFLMLTGMNFFISGLMADMLSKTYFQVTKDSPYDVEAVIVNSENT